MKGYHEQIGCLGKDRKLELSGNRLYWTCMQDESYILYCVPRCLRRKTQQDVAPLAKIETTQPLNIVLLDYLQIGPSKGNTEMFCH